MVSLHISSSQAANILRCFVRRCSIIHTSRKGAGNKIIVSGRYYNSSCLVRAISSDNLNGFERMPINGESLSTGINDIKMLSPSAEVVLQKGDEITEEYTKTLLDVTMEEHAQPTDDTNDESTFTTNNTNTTSTKDNILQHLQPRDSYAIFIDAQNTSIKHCELAHEHIQSSIPSHALPSIKRLYGDKTLLTNDKVGWSKFANSHGLYVPHIYPDDNHPNLHNIDILMVMDITESLYKHSHITTYILMTSDGDFSPLVHKLREAGKTVVGYGAKNITSRILANAMHAYFDTTEMLHAENERIMEEKKRLAEVKRIKREEGKKLGKKLAAEKKLAKEKQQLAMVAAAEKELQRKKNLSDEEKKGDSSSLMKSISRFFGTFFGFEQPTTTKATKDKTPNKAQVKDDPTTALSSNATANDPTPAESTPLATGPPTVSSTPTKGLSKTTQDEIHQLIREKMAESGGKGWVSVSLFGNLIDHKALGYKKINELFKDLDGIERKKKKSNPFIRLKNK